MFFRGTSLFRVGIEASAISEDGEVPLVAFLDLGGYFETLGSSWEVDEQTAIILHAA